jgi:hypothetical protein
LLYGIHGSHWSPEIDVPAGYEQVTYDPQYVLSEDRKTCRSFGTMKSMLLTMPISLMFWAGLNEPALIKAASAYGKPRIIESRQGFGPIPSEP